MEPVAINLTVKESKLLSSLIKKYKNILECKNNDEVATAEKEQTWIKLTDEFNKLSGIKTRTVENIKGRYNILKQSRKKKSYKVRMQRDLEFLRFTIALLGASFSFENSPVEESGSNKDNETLGVSVENGSEVMNGQVTDVSVPSTSNNAGSLEATNALE